MCISYEGFLTDHRLLEFDINTSVRKIKSSHRFVYNFKCANFEVVRSVLFSTDFHTIYDADDVNVAWSNFVDIFLSVLDRFVPKIKIKDPTGGSMQKSDMLKKQQIGLEEG